MADTAHTELLPTRQPARGSVGVESGKRGRVRNLQRGTGDGGIEKRRRSVFTSVFSPSLPPVPTAHSEGPEVSERKG